MGANSVLNAFRRRVLGRREGREEEEDSGNRIPLNQKQLVIHLADRSEPLRLDYQPEKTVRDICEEIAKRLDISPIALPFFTLVSIPEGHTLNQQTKLSKTEWEQTYDFKLAFKACQASRFKQPDIDDRNVIVYLFHQSRQEFLQDKITFSKEEEDSKNFVKLVVLELIYQSRQLNIKPQKLVDNAKQYQVIHFLKRGIFQQYDHKEVKSFIKKHLPKFQDLSEEKLMLEYLHVVEQAEMFFVYTFTVFKQFAANGRNHNVEYELLISPKYGIKKKEVGSSGQVPEVIVKDFSQVCGLEIGQTQSYQVIISRVESKPEVLSACSPQDAQSIVAIINGYYRLIVNRYRNLNALSAASTVKSKFHGPISRKMSMSILQAKSSEDGLYLIRQSRRVFGNHVLSLMYNNDIKHYEVIKDGKLFKLKDTSIEKKFKSLDDFVKYYEKNQDGLTVCLKSNCLPNDRGIYTNTIEGLCGAVKRKLKRMNDNDALLNGHPLIPATPRPQDLNQFGLQSIKAQDIKLINPIRKAGEFGNVLLSEWIAKEGENPLKIAVRKLKKKIYDEGFYGAEMRLIKLRNINIIRHFGLTQLKDSVGLVTEYAPCDLETYLKKEVSQPKMKGISRKSVILFAAQIAEGMMYLQDMKCVHGRLKAHNILVTADEQIKIADIGLMDLQSHGGEFLDVDRVSAGYCWHALEMLADPNHKPTYESDVWSLGVTMWEMFALKRPFHTSTSPKPLSREEILKRYHRDQYLSTQRENLPKGVASVIQKCWNCREEERISFSNIVTVLRDLIFKATPEESQSYSHELILEQKKEDWENPIKQPKEEKLLIKPLRLVPADDSYSVMAPTQVTGYSIQGRKKSLQRTFSDPGSPERVCAEPICEDLQTLPQRKVSLTRASSCPQCKLHAQPEKGKLSEETIATTSESGENRLESRQAADYKWNVFSNISNITPNGVINDDEHNQLMNDSDFQSNQAIVDGGEEKAMEFLGKQFSKAPLKPEDPGGDLLSNEHGTTNLEKTQDKDHNDVMAFLGCIIKQKGTVLHQPSGNITGKYVPHSDNAIMPHICSDTTSQFVHHSGKVSQFQPCSSRSGQYQDHPGAVSSLQPGSSRSGQYQDHPGVVSSLQPGSSRSGQYQDHPGAVSSLQPGSSRSGQYQDHPGAVSSLQPGSSRSGQYQDHPGAVSSLQPGSSRSGQYQDHPGAVSSLQPGSSRSGQYQDHPGAVSSLQPGNSRSGQYQDHPGAVSSLQPGSSRSGQYQDHPGAVSSLQPGNSRSGQYQDRPGAISSLQPGSSSNGQYQDHPSIVNPFNSGNSTASLSEMTFLGQGLDDFVRYHKDVDHHEMAYVTGTQVYEHENQGNIKEHAISRWTNDEVPGGWFCEVPISGCNKDFYKRAPINTTPTQENQGEHHPIFCEESARLSEKLDATAFSDISSLIAPSPALQDNQSKEETRRNRLEKLQEKIRPDFKIEKENLRPTMEIGRGNFGIVRRGTLQKYVKSRPVTEEVAVKELKKCPDEKSQDDFITEAINMQELSKIKNSNIIALIGICLDTESEVFLIVTELAPLGALPEYLQKKKERIGVHKLLEFCLQIANGMSALESENVLHRDLALRNILVAAEDQVKISDFGLSRLSDYYKASRGKWPMKWYAPESLEKGRFTTKSDVWSYGVTVWEMFNYGEKKPYPDVDNGKILEYILKDNRLPQPANCPDGIHRIMKQCWDKECTKRPTFYLCYKLIKDQIENLPTDEVAIN